MLELVLNNESNPPIPFLVPRFWLLVLKTMQMKWQHRNQGDVTYTEYLTKFYTRSKNRCIESYGDSFRDVRRLVASLVALETNDVILDVATGGGQQAIEFAARDHQVVGIDYVYDRVLLASEQYGHSHATWGVADASRLPFKDDAFDIVTISLALHDMPLASQIDTLRELQRVAHKQVIIVEPRAPNGWLWRHIYSYIGELLDESIHFRDYVLRDFEVSLENVGLRLTAWQRCYYGLLAVYICEPRAKSCIQPATAYL